MHGIVIGYDGSESAGRALERAAQLADPDAAVGVATRARADLIAVGHEHKGLVERLLMGSVSAGVTCRAECDVLVVN